MYYPYFIAYMAIGFLLSLVVFVWALNNGQFKDQERARFLPLHGDAGNTPVRKTRISRVEFYVLGGLAALGLLASATVLVFALVKAH